MKGDLPVGRSARLVGRSPPARSWLPTHPGFESIPDSEFIVAVGRGKIQSRQSVYGKRPDRVLTFSSWAILIATNMMLDDTVDSGVLVEYQHRQK